MGNQTKELKDIVRIGQSSDLFVIKGYAISKSNAELEANASYNTTNFLPLEGSESIRFNKVRSTPGYRSWYYDKNYSPLELVANTVLDVEDYAEKTGEILAADFPIGAKYVRFCHNASITDSDIYGIGLSGVLNHGAKPNSISGSALINKEISCEKLSDRNNIAPDIDLFINKGKAIVAGTGLFGDNPDYETTGYLRIIGSKKIIFENISAPGWYMPWYYGADFQPLAVMSNELLDDGDVASKTGEILAGDFPVGAVYIMMFRKVSFAKSNIFGLSGLLEDKKPVENNSVGSSAIITEAVTKEKLSKRNQIAPITELFTIAGQTIDGNTGLLVPNVDYKTTGFLPILGSSKIMFEKIKAPDWYKPWYYDKNFNPLTAVTSTIIDAGGNDWKDGEILAANFPEGAIYVRFCAATGSGADVLGLSVVQLHRAEIPDNSIESSKLKNGVVTAEKLDPSLEFKTPKFITQPEYNTLSVDKMNNGETYMIKSNYLSKQKICKNGDTLYFGSTNPNRVVKFALLSDTHFGYESWGDYSSFKAMIAQLNSIDDLDFAFITGDVLTDGYSGSPDLMAQQLADFDTVFKDLNCNVYGFKGNHDNDVERFPANAVIYHNGIKIINFFASYIGLPGEPGDFNSTGFVPQSTIDWVEAQLNKKDYTHAILTCHYSIITGDVNFKWPLLDSYTDSGGTYGEPNSRTKILNLAATHGVKLYINGHEHNSAYARGSVEWTNGADTTILTNVNGASTVQKFSIVTIVGDQATFEIYDTDNPSVMIDTFTLPI